MKKLVIAIFLMTFCISLQANAVIGATAAVIAANNSARQANLSSSRASSVLNSIKKIKVDDRISIISWYYDGYNDVLRVCVYDNVTNKLYQYSYSVGFFHNKELSSYEDDIFNAIVKE